MLVYKIICLYYKFYEREHFHSRIELLHGQFTLHTFSFNIMRLKYAPSFSNFFDLSWTMNKKATIGPFFATLISSLLYRNLKLHGRL